jgi:3-hydroxybutyrate dehydrogenase
MQLRGRTALVTGSTQGIGQAIATSLAEAGARIAVHGIASDQQQRDVCSHLMKCGSEEAKFFSGDLRDPDQIVDLIRAVNDWHPVDILVNNAGIQKTAALPDVDRGTWETIIAINLSAAFYAMQASVPGMAERGFGRVINIASVHGLVGSKFKAPYVAAKHGLVGLSKVVALEYAAVGDAGKGGVTVNCICPGFTETPLLEPQVTERAKLLGGDEATGVASLLSEKQPSLRMSKPSEIGALALWLCSPMAHNVTGTAIPVDGGWTAQ